MISRILQIVLGALFFFFAAPEGMAKDAIREEARAEVLAQAFDDETVQAEVLTTSDLNDEAGRPKTIALNETALLPSFEGEVESEISFDSEEDAKRGHKRLSSNRLSINKCRFIVFLSPESLAKGVSKHPATQDARQERTAAIRHLQIQALAC